ncbi:hypothetical protein F4778DRAFT_777506 [Xylariomycetidae sp. FL2044]|nr:hypothetical protein F4778DRAFT_777506 [Xylariomycetidae sp. FL2044]
MAVDASNSKSEPGSAYKPRYIDIGINLADPIFRGQYHGTQRHPDDLSAVVSRAQEVGCQKLIVTGSALTSSRHALEIAKEYPGVVYTTAGIHPCSSAIFSQSHLHVDPDGHTMPCDPDPAAPVSEDEEPDTERTTQIISDLRRLIEGAQSSVSPTTNTTTTTRPASSLVAFGEFGLDYDRLHYCSRRIQMHSFAAQLDLVLSLSPQPPLFLHSRAAHGDFVALLKTKFGARLEKLERGGVVHSFTGSAAEMRELMDLGLYVGTNGCSFKTAENCGVVREIRLDRLMLETDGPWCEIRPSHEGWKYLVEKKQKEKEKETAVSSASKPGEGVVHGDDGTPTGTGTAIGTATGTGTSTPGSEATSASASTTGRPARQQKQQQQQQQQRSNKKPQKREPEVPERWKVVKKEKWVEGAMVKGRNEPCAIERVAQVVAGVKGVSVEEVCEAAWRNTVKVFGLET